MSGASVTFYNVIQGDPCLTQDPCSVCLDNVTAENGKAHPPSLNWYQRLVCKKSPLQHAIHEACLENWSRTRLSNGQHAVCPTCRSAITLPLKDRVITEFTFILRDLLAGSIAGAIVGAGFQGVGFIAAKIIGLEVAKVAAFVALGGTGIAAATIAREIGEGEIAATIIAGVMVERMIALPNIRKTGIAAAVTATAIGVLKAVIIKREIEEGGSAVLAGILGSAAECALGRINKKYFA